MAEQVKMIRNNSATLVFGDTGTGKSSLIATYADYVWKKYRKHTLLYTTDGGGYPANVEALIRRGIIWVFKMRTRGQCFETIARASQGWWPERIKNAQTGEVDPGCKLLPPVETLYTMSCPNGHTVKQASDRRQFSSMIQCKECKSNTTLKNGIVKSQSVRTPGLEEVGGACFDGLTSMQAWIMTDLGQRTAHGELKGEETALGGKIQSGDMVFGGSNRSHYGQAQLRAEDWILDSTAIPDLVVPPFWTALEQRANDRDTKLPVYGPKISGSARTADVPSWVGNCLGTRIAINEGGVKEWRLYLSEWREEDGIPHLCKTRAMPGVMPEYLTDGGDFSQFSMGHLFELLDDALEKTMKDAEEEYADAPGLPSGIIGGPSKLATPKASTGNGKVAVPVKKIAGAKVVKKIAGKVVRKPPSAVPAKPSS